VNPDIAVSNHLRTLADVTRRLDSLHDALTWSYRQKKWAEVKEGPRGSLAFTRFQPYFHELPSDDSYQIFASVTPTPNKYFEFGVDLGTRNDKWLVFSYAQSGKFPDDEEMQDIFESPRTELSTFGEVSQALQDAVTRLYNCDNLFYSVVDTEDAPQVVKSQPDYKSGLEILFIEW